MSGQLGLLEPSLEISAKLITHNDGIFNAFMVVIHLPNQNSLFRSPNPSLYSFQVL